MKYLTNLILSFALIAAMVACGGGDKTETSPSTYISGPDSKTWVAKKEYNSAGDKDKLDGSEKSETMRFYSNGSFSMQSDTQTQNGQWVYNASNKTLALTFDGADVKEVFDVQELDENSMKVKASDGSIMVMKTK